MADGCGLLESECVQPPLERLDNLRIRRRFVLLRSVWMLEFCLETLCENDIRIPRTSIALHMSAAPAQRTTTHVHGLAVLTIPPYSLPRLLVDPLHLRRSLLFLVLILTTLRLGVPWIPGNPFLFLRRLSRTPRAPRMPTLSALDLIRMHELRLAFVAFPPDSLHHWCSDCRLAIPDNCQRFLPTSLFLVPIPRLRHGLLSLWSTIFLRALVRITWALFAPLMVAALASSVGAKGRLAKMTRAVYAHPDRLCYTFLDGGSCDDHLKFGGLKGEPVFGEESAGAFLLMNIADQHLDMLCWRCRVWTLHDCWRLCDTWRRF